MVHCANCNIKINKPVEAIQYKFLNVEIYECPSCGYLQSFERRLFRRERSQLAAPFIDKIPKRIQNLSTKALKYYRDALSAQGFHLPDLAGVALRMALEALVWDYLLRIKKIPENEIDSKNLYQRIQLMNGSFYTQICTTILRIYGNKIVHLGKDLPPLSLHEAFETYENLCILINNELSTLEINDALQKYFQGKAK